MSYCRWSSDRWQSDLYCYWAGAGHGGYVTHLASYRRAGPSPEVDWEASPDELRAQLWAEGAWLDATPLEPIGLPHDGQSFSDATLEEFLARLLMLREVGYHVPQHAIDWVRVDIAEEDKKRAEEGA